MNPKTQIEIGRWTTIVLLVSDIIPFLDYLKTSDLKSLWAGIFFGLLCVGILITISFKLLRMSFLLVSIIVISYCVEHIKSTDINYEALIVQLGICVLLTLGVIGIYREKRVSN
jgi:hypothetical protein